MRGNDSTPEAPSLAVYVCTHRRNDHLAVTIDSIVTSAKHAAGRARVGIVVVDDNPDGSARSVVDGFADTTRGAGLDLGIHYRHSGAQNISKARNLGIAAAMDLADWVGMVDDDEIVDDEWVAQLFAVAERTGADAVTGPVFVEYADDAPDWLRSQRIGRLFEAPQSVDGAAVDHASTGNSMISTAWLAAHPTHRFRDDLGTSGGEDMVFYRAAIGAGLRAHYALHAAAREVAPPERSTFEYVLRRSLWMGNTTAVTNLEAGLAGRGRLAVRALKSIAAAIAYPLRRLIRFRPPELRYTAARITWAAGLVSGIGGYRQRHR
ncbi:MAG: glycosyltransferase [Acidimicrobiales bacterium]